MSIDLTTLRMYQTMDMYQKCLQLQTSITPFLLIPENLDFCVFPDWCEIVSCCRHGRYGLRLQWLLTYWEPIVENQKSESAEKFQTDTEFSGPNFKYSELRRNFFI